MKSVRDRDESVGEIALFQQSLNPDYEVKAATSVLVMNRPIKYGARVLEGPKHATAFVKLMSVTRSDARGQILISRMKTPTGASCTVPSFWNRALRINNRGSFGKAGESHIFQCQCLFGIAQHADEENDPRVHPCFRT